MILIIFFLFTAYTAQYTQVRPPQISNIFVDDAVHDKNAQNLKETCYSLKPKRNLNYLWFVGFAVYLEKLMLINIKIS